ncbi:hypothetical protein C8R43DRAFT_940794 [Mycena crocata]|nr:hypothetical protein C8R43DRAFT_940794 [Mycena crocata]
MTATALADNVTVTEMSEGRTNWRICAKDTLEDVSDEIVLRVQGILTKNQLVPRGILSCPQQRAINLSQFAEICGDRTPTFDDAMLNITTIYECFHQQLAGVEIVNAGDKEKNGQSLFNASNRLFTFQSDSPTEQNNEFQRGVDPFRQLEKFKTSGELIHAPENIVKYFHRIQGDGDNPATYEGCIPGAFEVGDLVEMQVSFVALAVGKNKIKIHSRLQALTLLDKQFTKEAKEARTKARSRVMVNPAVRRKVGYFAEDADEERKIKKRRTSSPDGRD